MPNAQSSMHHARRRREMKLGFRSWSAALVTTVGVMWIAAVVLSAGKRDPARTAAGPTPETLQQQEDAQRRPVVIDNDDIGGVVSSAKGPEAGVWVIAETKDLPTRFAKIVVTNDRGQYVIPDLPKANYTVWVRGYGLVDSPKVAGVPGKMLDLKAVIAPNAKAAAQYYPAAYWMSLLNVPDKSEFPGKGGANNFSANIKSQDHFLALMKTGDIFGSCMTCHQLGDKATREIPKELGTFANGREAWLRRIQSRPAGADMGKMFSFIVTQRTVALFAHWAEGIARGPV